MQRAAAGGSRPPALRWAAVAALQRASVAPSAPATTAVNMAASGGREGSKAAAFYGEADWYLPGNLPRGFDDLTLVHLSSHISLYFSLYT